MAGLLPSFGAPRSSDIAFNKNTLGQPLTQAVMSFGKNMATDVPKINLQEGVAKKQEEKKTKKMGDLFPQDTTELVEPTKPTEENARLQKLQKFNALGQMIGSIFDLGTTATGGMVGERPDYFGSFAVDRMQGLDDRYWKEMQQHRDDVLQQNRFNLGQQGRENVAEWNRDNQLEDQQFRKDERLESEKFSADQTKEAQKARLEEIDYRSKAAIKQAKAISSIKTEGDEYSPEQIENFRFIYNEYDELKDQIDTIIEESEYLDDPVKDRIEILQKQADELKDQIPKEMLPSFTGISLKEDYQAQVKTGISKEISEVDKRFNSGDYMTLSRMLANPNSEEWGDLNPNIKGPVMQYIQQKLYELSNKQPSEQGGGESPEPISYNNRGSSVRDLLGTNK